MILASGHFVLTIVSWPYHALQTELELTNQDSEGVKNCTALMFVLKTGKALQSGNYFEQTTLFPLKLTL